MNIDVKNFNKMLANRVQQDIKKKIHNDQVKFMTRRKARFYTKSIKVIYHVKRIKKKNHIIILINAKNLIHLTKSYSCPWFLRKLSENWDRRELHQLEKYHLQKKTLQLTRYLMGKDWLLFPLRLETKQESPVSLLLLTFYLWFQPVQ